MPLIVVYTSVWINDLRVSLSMVLGKRAHGSWDMGTVGRGADIQNRRKKAYKLWEWQRQTLAILQVYLGTTFKKETGDIWKGKLNKFIFFCSWWYTFPMVN